MTEYARPFRHDALFSSYYLERVQKRGREVGSLFIVWN
jgi:hypothetical protein